MTDFEKYKQLFTETGVPFRVEDSDLLPQRPGKSNESCVWLEVSVGFGEADIVQGYNSFFNALKFDKQTGKLIEFGIWE